MSQSLATAAGEKLARMMTIDYLLHEAASERREYFERYLNAMPDQAASETTSSTRIPNA